MGKVRIKLREALTVNRKEEKAGATCEVERPTATSLVELGLADLVEPKAKRTAAKGPETATAPTARPRGKAKG